jgi:hypothetical protein
MADGRDVLAVSGPYEAVFDQVRFGVAVRPLPSLDAGRAS